jgi:lipopolysaccharide export system protein LptA
MKKKIFLITILMILFTKSIAPSYAEDITIEANKQSYNGETNSMTFDGNVKVKFEDVSIKSPKAFLKAGNDGKPQAATFIQGAEAVKISGDSQSNIKASIIKVSILENKIKAEGKANSQLMQNKQVLATIKSNYQELDLSKNIITATGNVNIDYKDITTNSDSARIEINQNGKPKLINLVGSAKVVQGKNIVNATNLLFNPESNELVASGNVHSKTVLDDMTQVSVKSSYQQLDQNTNTLITSGQVVVVYQNYIASGPKASFLPGKDSKKPNKIVFMGRSKIQEGDRIIEADKLEITVNPKNFIAEGNVRSKFTKIQGLDSNKKTNKKK